MRWYGGKDGDPRPVTYPTPIEWWCTGYREDDVCTICAVVDAQTPAAAWKHVRKYWPEAEESFCEEKPSNFRPDPGRFTPKEASSA